MKLLKDEKIIMVDDQVSSKCEKGSRLKRAFDGVASWLTNPRLPVHLFILSMVLTLPFLWVGFQWDDYYMRFIMLGLDPSRGPFQIFSFVGGAPQIDAFKDLGVFPWWTSSHFHIVYFRYLSAFSMWIDYLLWPNRPALMHLHSMLLYGGVVIAVCRYYRRIMGLTVAAGLAALFYAVDYSHASPVSYLGNRDGLLAAFFGVLCLLSYDRCRREGKGRHGVPGTICFALALLSYEMASATAAYLFAHALFIDHHRWRERLKALWPYAGIFIVYAIIYKGFGFGFSGTGFYIDPLARPAAFAGAFVTRAPLLLMAQWSNISPDSIGIDISREHQLIFAVPLIVVLVFVLFPLIWKDRVARFWLTGMLLSLLPLAGTEASSRALCFVGLGAMGLMAQFIIHLRRNDGVLPSSRFWRIPAVGVAIYLLLVRLLFSPVVMPVATYLLKPIGQYFADAARNIPDDEGITGQDLIIVNTPFTLATLYIRPVRALAGKRPPASVRELSAEGNPVEIYRVDECTLRVRIPGGLLRGRLGSFFRSPEEEPIMIDEEFRVPPMTVRVTQTGKDGPEEMIYHFSVPLEHPSLKWLQWKNRTFAPFVPPAIGQSVSFPPFNLNQLCMPGRSKR
ncbi:MAG: hypothetical protein ABSF90_26100 [Syntrophobacteraceae bacterium]